MRFGLLVVPALVAGCSLIYNPDGIPTKQDAPTIPPADVDPTMLVLDSVAPVVIREGQGDGNSRPAIVVCRGHQIAADATVEIVPVDGTTTIHLDVGTPVIAPHGDFIAVAVTAHVDSALDEVSVSLVVKVTQPAGATPVVAMLTGISLQGLKEANSAADVMPPRPLGYSVVDITSGGLNYTPAADLPAALIRAESSIMITGDILASGAAGTSSGGAGGPGGCKGGNAGIPGSCAGAGGAASANNAGGGGAGFATGGTAGDGMNAGGAGAQVGTASIATYTGTGVAPNVGSGGGGGNAALLSNAGGGGGGGGTIELTAGGDVHIVGSITANGGKGGDASGAVASGGGGGGAGGAVMLRSGGELIAGAITVTAGGGGAKGGLTGGNAGGAGANGRVRWDSPSRPPAHRGPTFDMMTPTTVTAEPSIGLHGTSGDQFTVYVIDQDNRTDTNQPQGAFSSDNTANLSPMLHDGYNRLCITLQGGTLGQSESDKCIDIAYLP